MENEVTEDFIKSVKKDYYREYRQKNKEKMKEAQKRFWQKKALEIKENEK